MICRTGQNVFNLVEAGPPARLTRRKNRVRAKSNFVRQFNVICSSSPPAKNILLLFFRNL